jgi:hypothetical protein
MMRYEDGREILQWDRVMYTFKKDFGLWKGNGLVTSKWRNNRVWLRPEGKKKSIVVETRDLELVSRGERPGKKVTKEKARDSATQG